jgi:hypothetical protein
LLTEAAARFRGGWAVGFPPPVSQILDAVELVSVLEFGRLIGGCLEQVHRPQGRDFHAQVVDVRRRRADGDLGRRLGIGLGLCPGGDSRPGGQSESHQAERAQQSAPVQDGRALTLEVHRMIPSK